MIQNFIESGVNMPAFIWLQGDINPTILPNTGDIPFEFLTFFVLFINLITVNQSRILIIDRNLEPQIGKSVNLKINLLPSGKLIRINMFD